MSMQPTIELYIGAPLSGSEAYFLRRIHVDLAGHAPCVILANFEIPHGKGQVDFLVVTPQRAQLIELKCFTGRISGGENGPWTITDQSGVVHEYPKNQWTQTRDLKYALNDFRHACPGRDSAIPGPTKGRYFDFDASVVIIPRIEPGSHITVKDNFKARVQSYSDVLRDLTTRPLPSTWTLEFSAITMMSTGDCSRRAESALAVSLQKRCANGSRCQRRIGRHYNAEKSWSI